jgi:alpha-ketoglutaric semialdehyde dehydrogenase
MKPDGGSLIGFGSSGTVGATFKAFDPAVNQAIEPSFICASAEDVARAAELAAEAAPRWAALSGRVRNRFLQTIANNLEAKADDLVERAHLETGLTIERLKGELARTGGQLRLYGDAAEQGAWLDARIETADPTRTPTPKPDHRSMLRAIGPVVVFGSSNFPFAYSVAGGDTASAFAAGCPVIVKAHPAHPGTSEMVGRLLLHAVRECELPEGTFSLLFDDGFEIGQALVKHPAVKAVGFTGSLKGGMALVRLANDREQPIPVYAEMGSINPIFILPGALRERADAIVEGLHGSTTLGVGQYCTNPGVVVLERSSEAEKFVRDLSASLQRTSEAPMLTPGIHKNFVSGTATRAEQPGVRQLVAATMKSACGAAPVWFETEALDFLSNPGLQTEIFGPSSLVVWCRDRAEVLQVASALEGSLTAMVHAASSEVGACQELLAILAAKAGRLIYNGYSTGLEVSSAIVHGGPFPATSDGGRSTSVGTRALTRWARLVCYQNFAEELLPPELQDSNPVGISRLVNGERAGG